MNNKSELTAELQAIETTLDGLEAEYDKGMIDIGRYMQLRKGYETRKAELEQELGSGSGGTGGEPARKKPSFSTVKRKTLENRHAELVKEYEAANAHLGRVLSAVDRVRIQRQIDDLEKQIKDIEQQIENIE